MTQPRRRQRTSIQARGADDHFRSRYERDVQFHRKRQREIVTQIAVAGVVVGLIVAGASFVFGGTAKKSEQLPMTQFELAAKQKAAKAGAAKPKVKTASSAKSSSTSAKKKSGGTATAQMAATPKTTTASKPAAKKPVAPATAAKPTAAKMVAAALPGTQVFSVKLGEGGFEPSTITAAPRKPIRVVVDAAGAGPAGFVIADLDADADNTNGPAAVDLGSLGAGTYTYTSYDGSISGTLVVK